MTVTHAVARPMLAGMFVYGGLDSVRNPEPKAPKAETVGVAVAEPLGLPTDPVTLVRINGAVQVTAGALLAVGKLPRLSSLVLAASLVPTTIAGHRFWEEEDERQRAQQRIHFLKNVAMLGGLVFAATDTGGRPSLTWRAKRATKRSRQAAKAAKAAAATAAAGAGKKAEKAGRKAAKAGTKAKGRGAETARDLAGAAALSTLATKAKDAASSVDWDGVADQARESASRAVETASEAARQTAEWARETGLPKAREAAASVDWEGIAERAKETASRAKETASTIPWDKAAARAKHAAGSVDWDDVAEQARESAGRALESAAARARNTAGKAAVAAELARRAVPA